MSIIKGVVIGVVFVLFAIACSQSKKSRGNFMIADSKSYEASLYRANCAICHGVEAYGKMVDGKQVPSLRVGDAAKKSEAEIYQQIAHGKLPMPSFDNQLTETEIRKMAKFVMRDLQGRELAGDKNQ